MTKQTKLPDTTRDAVQRQLTTVGWSIEDAQERVLNAAEQMKTRANDAVSNARALTLNEPHTLNWVDFAEDDLREARAARMELEELLRKQKLLRMVLKAE